MIVSFYLSITVVIGFNSAHLIETTPKLNQYKTQSMLFIPLSCPDDSRKTLISTVLYRSRIAMQAGIVPLTNCHAGWYRTEYFLTPLGMELNKGLDAITDPASPICPSAAINTVFE